MAVTLSLRDPLVLGLEGLLAEAGLSCRRTADALAELVVSLSHYREEGTALYPMVFLGVSAEATLAAVGGEDPLTLGEGPADAATIRMALKRCAPLCVGRHWAIHLTRTASAEGPPRFQYGIFRADPYPLTATPMERLQRSAGGVPVFGVLQRAPDLVEIRGAGGLVRQVSFAAESDGGESPTRAIAGLARAMAADVAEPLAGEVYGFFRRGLISVLQSGHGSLVAVLGAQSSLSRVFADGVLLAPRIDIAQAIADARGEDSREHAARVRAYGHLFEAMLGMDGVTVVSSAGELVGYHVFLRDLADGAPPSEGGTLGGARRRTFEALAAWVDRGLDAAFYRSQDGAVALRTRAR